MARKETANQTTARGMSQRPSQADYEALSEFRYLIRCFLQFSQNLFHFTFDGKLEACLTERQDVTGAIVVLLRVCLVD